MVANSLLSLAPYFIHYKGANESSELASAPLQHDVPSVVKNGMMNDIPLGTVREHLPSYTLLINTVPFSRVPSPNTHTNHIALILKMWLVCVLGEGVYMTGDRFQELQRHYSQLKICSHLSDGTSTYAPTV